MSSATTPAPSPVRKSMWVLVAVLSLAAGLLAARFMDPRGASSTAASGSPAAQSVVAEQSVDELNAIQESLINSQILPSNFKTVPPFALLDVNGDPLTESVLDDQWSLMFFGFTHCPDVCPITLSVMKDATARLTDAGTPPMQTVFVTVDPVRDTPDVMRNYVGFFDKEFVGVTGELTAIHELTRYLGIVASYTASESDDGNYSVDHTASMLLIDPQRRVRARFHAPHVAETIAADFTTLHSTLN